MTPAPGDAAPLLTPVSIVVLAVGAACAGLVFAMRRSILRPDALRERAHSAASVPAVIWLTAGFLGWLVWGLGNIFAMSALPADPAPSLPTIALASIPAYLLGLAGVIVALWGFRGTPTMRACRIGGSDIGAGAITLGLGLPIVLAVAALSLLAATLLSQLTGTADPDQVAHGTLNAILELRASSGISWWLLPVVIQVVVLAPVLEEVLYRGCLQSSILSATGKTWPSVLAASAIFAMIHIPAVPWHALPTLFAVGIVCGLSFERTGRLAPAMLFHAAFNALNLGVTLASTAPVAPGGG